MGSTAVPATPVVVITVHDDRVTVNGDVIEHDGSRSPHEVAVHTVAVRVAQVLSRPVRAIAEDSSGRTHFVVHEDGTVSDLVTEPTGAVATPQREQLPEAAPAEHTTSLEDLMGTSAAPQITSSSRRPVYLVAVVAAAALMTAGGGYATVQALGPATDSDTTPEASAVASTELVAPSTPSVSVTPTPAPAATAPAPRPLLRVKASVRKRTVGVQLLATPATKVTVRLAVGRWAKTKTVRVAGKGRVEFTNVPAGKVRWRAASGTGRKAQGQVSVKAPPVAPSPRPRVTPAPRPRVYQPRTPRITAPRPAPRPAPKPAPRPKPKPKGSGPKGPGQQGDTGPKR